MRVGADTVEEDDEDGIEGLISEHADEFRSVVVTLEAPSNTASFHIPRDSPAVLCAAEGTSLSLSNGVVRAMSDVLQKGERFITRGFWVGLAIFLGLGTVLTVAIMLAAGVDMSGTLFAGLEIGVPLFAVLFVLPLATLVPSLELFTGDDERTRAQRVLSSTGTKIVAVCTVIAAGTAVLALLK
jgi:hypothetical protein